MHTHLYYKGSVEMSDHLAEMRALMDAQGYTGAWSVECYMGVNEYANVEAQLANVWRVLDPTSYNGRWKVAPPAVVAGNTADKLNGREG